MAENTITINFTPCEPTPVNGYVIKYRPVGSGIPYRTAPTNFTESPAVFVDNLDAGGTDYEGYIQGDCGDGKLGFASPWLAENEGPLPVFTPVNVRYVKNPATICAATPIVAYLLAPATAVGPGVVVYETASLSDPLTGSSFIAGPLGVVYNIAPGTGVVGSATGATC